MCDSNTEANVHQATHCAVVHIVSSSAAAALSARADTVGPDESLTCKHIRDICQLVARYLYHLYWPHGRMHTKLEPAYCQSLIEPSHEAVTS